MGRPAFLLLAVLAGGCVDTNGLSGGAPPSGAIDGGSAFEGGRTDRDADPDADADADAASVDASALTYAAMTLADGPVAYFRLGEKSGTLAADASGRGNDGTWLVGSQLGVAGAISGDADTAGDVRSGGVRAPIGIDFSGTSAFSLEAWALFSTIASYQHLFNKDTDPNGGPTREQFGIFVNDNGGGDRRIVLERYVAGQARVARAPAPSPNVFHHIVGTYDGSGLTLYVDGVASLGDADTRAQLPKSVPMFLGTKGEEFNRWPGVIDEVAIYDRALTAADIQRHYAKGRGL